jgi:hypothetical protein
MRRATFQSHTPGRDASSTAASSAAKGLSAEAAPLAPMLHPMNANMTPSKLPGRVERVATGRRSFTCPWCQRRFSSPTAVAGTTSKHEPRVRGASRPSMSGRRM